MSKGTYNWIKTFSISEKENYEGIYNFFDKNIKF